jgi:hypothetical protein
VLVVPALLAVGALVLLQRSYAKSPALLASSGQGLDQDMDGLSDYQEDILGTNPLLADSDSDTFGDLEEVARQSDPLEASSIPGVAEVEVGMFARDQAGTLTIGSAVYLAGTHVPQMRFDLGIVINGMRASVPSDVYMPFTDVTLKGGRDPGSMVITMQTSLPRSLVWSLGKLAVFATLTDPQGPPDSGRVDVLNLTAQEGVIMSIEAVAYPDPGQSGPNNSSSLGPSGLIYLPLSDGENLPSSFTAGEVCWQVSSTVGVNGSSFVQEIVDADCEPSESFCGSAGCQASVGQVIEIVDPSLLIGG